MPDRPNGHLRRLTEALDAFHAQIRERRTGSGELPERGAFIRNATAEGIPLRVAEEMWRAMVDGHIEDKRRGLSGGGNNPDDGQPGLEPPNGGRG